MASVHDHAQIGVTTHRTNSRSGRSGRRSVLKSCVHPRTDHSVRYAPGGLPGDRSYRAERRIALSFEAAFRDCTAQGFVEASVVGLATGCGWG
jgi:hypothetical protein